MLRPYPLSAVRIEAAALTEDKKRCRKIGPCGVGKQALYLNSYFLDRRYYIPFSAVDRVYKRIAMSKGGFSGKGIFATLAYLVVVFDGGREKAFQFKYEAQIDELLAVVRETYPDIPCVSAAAEKRIEEARIRRETERKNRPPMSEPAKKTVRALDRAIDYLQQRPELAEHLSSAAKRRRNYQCTSGSYRWAAMAITLLGFAALAYGVLSFLRGGTFAIYFTLFGLAAIFTFAGFSVLPTARNNRTAVMENDARAQENMQRYLSAAINFPLPARYAHPAVLRRMQRVIEEGRAVTAEQALEVVKADLKALNADVEVSQEEYDEVVAIKPMFLNAEYQ